MKTIIHENEIDLIFNGEVIRDFCGTWHHFNGDSNNYILWIEFIQILPEAIHTLCSHYHFAIGDNVKASKSKIYDLLVEELKDIIPLDSSKWNDLDLAHEVYDKVFNITYCDLGKRLRYVCENVLNSDYYKAKRLVDNLDDPEMKEILSKAINGHKLDKIDLGSLGPYFKMYPTGFRYVTELELK